MRKKNPTSFLTALCCCLMAVLLLTPFGAMAQTRVSGKITDRKTGNPIDGVSVRQKGSTLGTATDISGSFTLSVTSPQTAVLLVSYVGYLDKEVPVAGNVSNIKIELEEDPKSLDDVVMIGYTNVQRRQTSAAISSVKGKDIENIPFPTFDAMLQGRVAGLNILAVSAEPGASGIVNIRGNSSVANSNGTGTAAGISAPLYVIDGVVFDVNDIRTAYGNSNPLAAINPNDIESIDVLKDASAAAIYGARAANGVILVKTKRPKGGKPQFRVSSYVGLVTQPGMKKVTIGAEERRLKMDIFRNQASYAQQQNINQFLTDSLNPAFNNATDFQDLFFKDGFIRNVDFNIAGLSDNMSYRLSLNSYNETGLQPGYGINRTTPRLFVSFKPTKNVEFTTDLYFGFIKEQRGDGRAITPFTIQNFPSSFWRADDATKAAYAGKNDRVRDDNRTTSINGNTKMIWKLTPDITFSSSLSYNYGFARRDYLRDRTVLGSNGRSDATTFSSNSRRWEIENYATWIKSFGPGKEHSVSVLVGQGAEEQVINTTNGNANGIPFDAIRIISGVPPGANLNVSTNFEERSRISYFTRAGYTYKGRYGLDLSFRRDASSRYAESSRWGTFPAVSGRWTVSDEPFFEPLKNVISFLKFRASYGVTGRDPGNYYAQYRQLTTSVPYPTGTVGGVGGAIVSYNGQTAITPNYAGVAPATNITWEKAPQSNYGVDLNLFNDRISMSVDLYNKASKDLIFTVPVPITTGYTSAQNNYVDLVNQGLEISINTDNLSRRSAFKWQTNLNVAFNKNFVTKLPDGNRDFTYGPSFRSRILTIGQPVYGFRVFNVPGVYPTTGDVPVDPLTGRRLILYGGGSGFVGGDPAKQDINGDYNVDDNDQVTMGDPNTKVYGGLTNTFSYKGFSLQVLTTFITGRSIWNGYLSDEMAAASLIANYGFYAGPAADLTSINFWRKSGDKADFGNLLSTADATTIRSSSYVEDGSFFRIRTINLGYTIPDKFTRKLGLRQIRFYSVLDNVAVFYKAHIPDPEIVDADGAAGGAGYPLPKKITFGIDIQF